MAKRKCGSGGSGGVASPIYKQASVTGRLIQLHFIGFQAVLLLYCKIRGIQLHDPVF